MKVNSTRSMLLIEFFLPVGYFPSSLGLIKNRSYKRIHNLNRQMIADQNDLLLFLTLKI